MREALLALGVVTMLVTAVIVIPFGCDYAYQCGVKAGVKQQRTWMVEDGLAHYVFDSETGLARFQVIKQAHHEFAVDSK